MDDILGDKKLLSLYPCALFLHDCGREVNTARCYFKGKQDCQWPLLQGCQHTAHFDLKWSGPVKLRFCQCKEVTTTTVFLLDKEKAAVAKTEIHQHNSGLTWFYFFGLVL